MIGHWITFSIILVIATFGIPILRKKYQQKYNWNEKQRRISYINSFKYIVFYYMVDFFYMVSFIDNIVWQFILGILLLVTIFYNLSNSFIIQKERTNFTKIGLLQDFLIGIALTIYLIYTIPNKEIQEIIIPIISAIYGGLLTLVGVAWTIKHGNYQQLEQVKEMSKPLFYNLFKNCKEYIYFCDFENEKKILTILSIKNTDKCPMSIEKLEYANNIMYPFNTNVIDKSQTIALVIKNYSFPDKFNLVLYIKAMDNSKYKYSLKCEKYDSSICKIISIDEIINKK